MLQWKVLLKLILFLNIMFIGIGCSTSVNIKEVLPAVAEGNVAKLKDFLEKDPNLVNLKVNKKETLLYQAVMFSQKEVVELLISKGANVNDGTPLLLATMSADLNTKEGQKYKDIAILLISKGADVNAKDYSGITPLHWVKDKEVAALLISKGADVNDKSTGGMTPLHFAFNKEIAELLISKGADVNVKTDDGATPLHFVGISKSKNIAELLISQGADVNAKNDMGYTPLHSIVSNSEKGDDIKELVELLISQGADVNAKTNDGETSLDIAKRYERDDIVDILIKNGALNNERNNKSIPIEGVRASNFVDFFKKEGFKSKYMEKKNFNSYALKNDEIDNVIILYLDLYGNVTDVLESASISAENEKIFKSNLYCLTCVLEKTLGEDYVKEALDWIISPDIVNKAIEEGNNFERVFGNNIVSVSYSCLKDGVIVNCSIKNKKSGEEMGSEGNSLHQITGPDDSTLYKEAIEYIENRLKLNTNVVLYSKFKWGKASYNAKSESDLKVYKFKLEASGPLELANESRTIMDYYINYFENLRWSTDGPCGGSANWTIYFTKNNYKVTVEYSVGNPSSQNLSSEEVQLKLFYE